MGDWFIVFAIFFLYLGGALFFARIMIQMKKREEEIDPWTSKKKPSTTRK